MRSTYYESKKNQNDLHFETEEVHFETEEVESFYI